jgi:hypothetical protein
VEDEWRPGAALRCNGEESTISLASREKAARFGARGGGGVGDRQRRSQVRCLRECGDRGPGAWVSVRAQRDPGTR